MPRLPFRCPWAGPLAVLLLLLPAAARAQTGPDSSAAADTAAPAYPPDFVGRPTASTRPPLTADEKAALVPVQAVVVSGLPPDKTGRRLRRRSLRLDHLQAFRQDSAELVGYLRKQGYAAAQVQARRQHDTLRLRYQPGRYYYYDSLRLAQVAPKIRDELELQKPARKQHPFSWEDWQARSETLLAYYENHGLPYAQLAHTGLAYQPSPTGDSLGVRLAYELDAGPLVQIDSVRVTGNIRERKSFVSGLIGLAPGDLYNQAAVERIPEVLNNTIYYKNTKPAQVHFRNDRAILDIDVERRKANLFDGILGLLPPRDESQALQFTGLLDFRLVSAFHTGEIIRLHFEKLTSSSQTLNLGYTQPFLFGSNFNLSVNFELLKQDSTFLTREFIPTISYRFSPDLSLRFQFRSRTSTLLNPDPFRERVWPPPPVLDTRSNSVSLGLEYDTRDNIRNPGRGIFLSTDFAIGTKRVDRTFGLDSLDYSRLALNQPRREFELEGRYFLPAVGPTVLVLGNHTYILNLDEFLNNDLKQLGGAKNLRGFNENEFLASLFSIATLEYRLRMGGASYIGLFTDWAYVETQSVGNLQTNRPMSLGFALNFQTAAGVMNVSYAIGQDQSRDFQPSRGRVHIGLLNEF